MPFGYRAQRGLCELGEKMHERLEAIQEKLNQVVTDLRGLIPNNEPLAIAHGQWNCPGLTRDELVEEVESLNTLIDDRGATEIGDCEERLTDYVRRLEHLRTNTIPQFWSGNVGPALSAFVLTLNGLRKALEPALTRDNQQEASAALKRLTTQLRAMEARLADVEPRTTTLSLMVERIENAHNAADQLTCTPTAVPADWK